MRLAAVVVTHNSERWLHGCVSALGALGLAPADAWVVDNASEDETRSVARELGLHVVNLDRNVGFAAAMNIGVVASQADRGDWILLINPDVAPAASRGSIDLRAELAALPPDTAVVIPCLEGESPNTMRYPSIVTALRWLLGASAPQGTLDLTRSYVVGSLMLVRRSEWDSVGGMDVGYFLYGEDAALSVALSRRVTPSQVRSLPVPLTHHGNAPIAGLPERQQVWMFESMHRLLSVERSRRVASVVLGIYWVGYTVRSALHLALGRGQSARQAWRAARAARRSLRGGRHVATSS